MKCEYHVKHNLYILLGHDMCEDAIKAFKCYISSGSVLDVIDARRL